MSYVFWKLERYPLNSDGTGWESTPVDVTTFYDPTVTVNLGDARDTFSFKVTNFNSESSNYFKPNEKITIYRKVNSSTVASSDVLMVGSIQNTPEEVSGKKNMIRVEGANFSETILSAIVFFDPQDQGLNIPRGINAALLAASIYNTSFGVTWDTAFNGDPATITRSDGTAFPNVNEKWYNKPIKNFLEKYSTNDATGDGNYYYYVTNENKLRWKRKEDSPSYSFDASTAKHKSFRITKDLKDVKNWIILKGGISPKGAAIQTRVHDISSIAKNGIKPYILVNNAKYAETLLKGDLNAQGVTGFSDMSFSPAFTPSWSGGVSYASADLYDAALVAYVKERIRLDGEAFLQARAKGKLKVDISFSPGEVTWGLGEVIACTIPSLSDEAKNMRVDEIVYGTEMDTYTLVEDIGSI